MNNQLKYYPKLDHLRFYAAFLVILSHYFPIVKNLGSLGVTLFMVLSGFILTVIVQAGGKEIVYKDFIFKRFLRIFPLFAFLFFILYSLGRKSFEADTLFYLFFLQTNIGAAGTGFGHDIIPITGQTWTIAVEFEFYLIFPFLVLFLHRMGVQYLLKLLFFLICIRYLTSVGIERDYWNYYHTILGRIDQFIIGMLLGWCYVYKKLNFNKFTNLFILFLSIAILPFFYSHNIVHSRVIGLTIESILSAGIIWGYSQSTLIYFPQFINKTLEIFGKISYSIYLLHILILLALTKMNVFSIYIFSDPFINKLAILLLIIMPVILFISYLSYSVIEKPFMSLGKKYIK